MLYRMSLRDYSYGIDECSEVADTPGISKSGVSLGDHTAIVAISITKDEEKLLMGVRVCSTENAHIIDF